MVHVVRWMMMRSMCAVLAAALVGCAAQSPEVRGGTNQPPGRSANETRAQLDVDAIVVGMQEVKPAVQACFDRYKAAGLFSVALTIVGDGHVASAHVLGPHPPTNDCVGHAVFAARFPPFSGPPQSVVYPFVLRAPE